MSDSPPRLDHLSAEDIVRARDLFRRTGALHDIQLFNLKVWPLVAFPMAKKARMVLNFEERDVVLELEIPWYRRTPDVRARSKGLNDSVQFLLGLDFRILVTINGKEIFRGDRVEPIKTKDFTGTDFEAGKIVPSTPWRFK